MKTIPSVSIIITTYNRPRYVVSAIESVLCQTFRDYELIVIDDGSEEKMEWIADRYENVEYVYQENRGLAAARNTGIRRSKGKYLAFLDDDDLFEPNKLKWQVPVIESDPQVGFVYSDYYLFWDDDLLKRELSLATGREGPAEEFCTKFFVNHNVAVPTLLIRRECFEDVGMFDEGLAQHEDGDMFMRIGLRWKVAFNEFPCALVRIHTSKMSNNRPSMYRSIIRSWDKILSDNPDFYLRLGGIADSKMKTLTVELICALVEAGNKEEAIGLQVKVRSLFNCLSRMLLPLMLFPPGNLTGLLKGCVYRLEKTWNQLCPKKSGYIMFTPMIEPIKKNLKRLKNMSNKAAIRTKENFLVFGSPLIEDAEIEEVVASMKTGWLGTGPKVARFEQDFAAYKRVQFAAALNSCTAALHLSILAAGIKPGDEVITTPMTFCATVNAIIHAGATPVLADIDPLTMNIDPDEIEKKITGKTRALLPVHFAGRPCNMDRIMAIAAKHDLKVIEDCAHAIETEYRGGKAGTFGDFGCFSFYVTKNIVTGEGGMVLAKREEDIARIKVLGLHGMSKDAWKRFSDAGYKHYEVVECGFKYNMMDLQAAIGIHQLQRIEPYWEKRRTVWERYSEEFIDQPIGLPAEPEPDTRHAYHLYSILIDEEKTGISRDGFLDAMTEQNIGVGVHYLSIPEHPYYQQSFGWKPEDYPHAMNIGRKTVSLPLSAKLLDVDIEDVITATRRILTR